MKNILKLLSILFIFTILFACNTSKKDILSKDEEIQSKLKILEAKYNLKRIPIKNGRNSVETVAPKVYYSIEEYEADLKKFKDWDDKIKKDNLEHEKFLIEVKKLDKFESKKFYDLVEKFPIIKEQLVRQNGGELQYNLKVKEAIEKEAIEKGKH